MRLSPQFLGMAAAVLGAQGAFAQLNVVSVTPGSNASNVAPSAEIVIEFDAPIALAGLPPATDDITVFGKSTGPASGTWTLGAAGLVARFTPTAPFAAGEVVQVSLSRDLSAVNGSALRSAGFHFEFRVATRPNSMQFTQIDTLTVRSSPGQGVRVYGGQASDLDDDGWVDLAIVNQDSSDVRVFLNQADGSGLFDPFLSPVADTGMTPSPNESCDMDGDGIMDIVTGDKFGDSVTVLIGNGDGTFAPRASYSMGDLPRGLAVFDMDGDGDSDVACTNATDGNLSLRMNQGDGTLGPETTFEGGGLTEWGLASGDMNGDGVMDLVVGAQASQRLIVWLGVGDGTFVQGGALNGVDRVWMVVLGDVNGDGHLDVSTGNGASGTGTIALGDGTGNLSLGASVNVGGLVVATDLGDLDGDGDLDWVLSSFSGDEWTLLENDGAGNFTVQNIFPAVDNPACAIMFDFDGDHDLDLAFLDEIADEVQLWENTQQAQEFCTPAPTSMGFPALVSYTGSRAVGDNDLALHVAPMPDGFAFFFYGQSTAAPSPAGNGFLCLGTGLFRSSVGVASGNLLTHPLDLAAPPVPGAAILPGSTWNFQCVFRDFAAGGARYNFSGGLGVTFL